MGKDLSMIEFPYSIAGFAVGVIVGLTGVGGGALMTPLLVLGFGVAPVTAVGTDLLNAGFMKIGGAASHASKGHVDWRITGLLASGSIPGALVGLIALSILPRAGSTTHLVVATSLGFMLVLTALAITFRARLLEWAHSHSGRGFLARHQSSATVAMGAFIGLAALALLPRAGASAKVIVSTSLGVMLFITSLALVMRGQLMHWARSHAGQGFLAKHQAAATIAVGFFIGLAVTLSSVGAGAIGVTALVLLFPLLATTRIVGTDIAHAVPITLLAGFGHALFGNVNWWLLASLLIGSLPGIWLGSHLTARIPEKILRASLVAVLLFAGTKLLMG